MIFFILLVTESCRLCIVDLEFNYLIEFRFLFLLQSMDGEILNFSVTMKYTPFSKIQKNCQLCFISDGKKYRWYINVIRNEIHMLKKWCYWHEQIYYCRQSVSTKWKFNCKKKKQSRLKKCVMFLIWNTARKWNKYVKYWLICNNP